MCELWTSTPLNKSEYTDVSFAELVVFYPTAFPPVFFFSIGTRPSWWGSGPRSLHRGDRTETSRWRQWRQWRRRRRGYTSHYNHMYIPTWWADVSGHCVNLGRYRVRIRKRMYLPIRDTRASCYFFLSTFYFFPVVFLSLLFFFPSLVSLSLPLSLTLFLSGRSSLPVKPYIHMGKPRTYQPTRVCFYFNILLLVIIVIIIIIIFRSFNQTRVLAWKTRPTNQRVRVVVRQRVCVTRFNCSVRFRSFHLSL